MSAYPVLERCSCIGRFAWRCLSVKVSKTLLTCQVNGQEDAVSGKFSENKIGECGMHLHEFRHVDARRYPYGPRETSFTQSIGLLLVAPVYTVGTEASAFLHCSCVRCWCSELAVQFLEHDSRCVRICLCWIKLLMQFPVSWFRSASQEDSF